MQGVISSVGKMHTVCVNKHMHPERAAQGKGMMLETPLLREQDSRANEAQSPAMLFSLYTENKGAWTHLCLGRTINNPDWVFRTLWIAAIEYILWSKREKCLHRCQDEQGNVYISLHFGPVNSMERRGAEDIQISKL